MEFLVLGFLAFVYLCAIIQWANTPEPSKKTRSKKESIPIIDKTEEFQNTYNYLVNNYSKFLNYSEIISIQEKDRLPILKYIWKRWRYRNILQSLRKKYPNYEKDILETIIENESSRIFVYEKWLEYKQENRKYLILVSSDIDWRTRYCLIDDIPEVFNYLGYDYYINFFLNYDYLKELQTEYVYFYVNNEFKQFEPAEFKKFCRENKYKYPFSN